MRRLASAWPWLAAAAALAALAAFYLAWPEKVFVFDGVMFALVIERRTDEWQAELFNRRHLLFNPCLMLLRDALGRLGLDWSGYALIQRVNALAGALGVALFYRTLRRLTEDRSAAVLAAAALALSYGYWGRAVEGQVYMLMTLGALACGHCALAYVAAPGLGWALGLSAALAGAVLFHAADAALLPMAAAALWLGRRRGGWLRGGLALAGLAACVAIPYVRVYGTHGGGLLGFFAKATEFYAPGQSGTSWGAIAWRFLTGGAPGGGLPGKALWILQGLTQALAAPATGGLWLTLSGLVLAAATVWAAAVCLRDPQRRPAAVVLGLWAAGFILLDTFWAGGIFFWGAPLAALLGLGVLALRAVLPARRAWLGLCACVILGLGAWNLRAAILPQSRIENNLGWRRSMFVADHTVASSYVVITGLGYPNAKTYLPFFAQRSRQVIEYFFLGQSREEGLRRLRDWAQRCIGRGIPLYMLSDLVEDTSVQESMRQAWGLGPQELMDCFGSGDFLLLAEQDPSFRVFLFLPQRERERLFAVLSYSALTDSDLARVRETAAAMRRLAQGMTPAQRRGAYEAMKQYNFGASLLLEEFSGSMNAASKLAAQKRLANFEAWKTGPDFHMRLGNILMYLGLKDEVRRHWSEAYRLTKDPDLAKDLAKLGR